MLQLTLSKIKLSLLIPTPLSLFPDYTVKNSGELKLYSLHFMFLKQSEVHILVTRNSLGKIFISFIHQLSEMFRTSR